MGSTVDGASGPKVTPGWAPPDDLVFQYLLREAVAGHVPVYFASVPIQRLQRFSPGFHPETTEGGAEVVAAIMSRWRAGDFAKMWVYPDGDHFVVADDYFTWRQPKQGGLISCPVGCSALCHRVQQRTFRGL